MSLSGSHNERNGTVTDHVDENPVRKSTGAVMVAIALAITAARAPMPWGEAIALGTLAWWGMHMAAGLKIKWRYPDQ